MSQLTNELNRVQDSRQVHPDLHIPDFYPSRKAPENNFNLIVITVIAAAGILAAYMINNKFYNLEKTIIIQDKKINDLSSLIINNKNLSDGQLQNLNFRLKDEADVRKIQINNVALVDNAYYINIMKAIAANTHQINYVNDYTKDLKNEIKKISASDLQLKVASSLAS